MSPEPQNRDSVEDKSVSEGELGLCYEPGHPPVRHPKHPSCTRWVVAQPLDIVDPPTPSAPGQPTVCWPCESSCYNGKHGEECHRPGCSCGCHRSGSEQPERTLRGERRMGGWRPLDPPEQPTCEVCGEVTTNGECPNDGDPSHDRIQNEIWDERGAR